MYHFSYVIIGKMSYRYPCPGQDNRYPALRLWVIGDVNKNGLWLRSDPLQKCGWKCKRAFFHTPKVVATLPLSLWTLWFIWQSLNSCWVVIPSWCLLCSWCNFIFVYVVINKLWYFFPFSVKYVINRLLHVYFNIRPDIIPRPISALGWRLEADMGVSGWYQGRYRKWHVIIYTYL